MARLNSGGRLGGSDFRRPPDWFLGVLSGIGIFAVLSALAPKPAPPVINIGAPSEAPPVVHQTTKVRVEIHDLDLGRYGSPVVTVDGTTVRGMRVPDVDAYIECEEFGRCSD